MRYAIFSDIHSNLHALKEVIKECQTLRIDVYLCAGDVVGYGGNPRECLHVLHSLNAVTVAGNHDWAVAGKIDFAHFTPDGTSAVMWTRNNISMEDSSYLNSLPLCLTNKHCTLVHSSLKDPEKFIYLTDLDLARATFDALMGSVCFLGHTHAPVALVEHEGRIYEDPNALIHLKDGCKYIINVGSVGQPRDGNPLASFCVYDSDAKTIEFKRLAYDVAGAQQRIIDVGLPRSLALRLAKGR